MGLSIHYDPLLQFSPWYQVVYDFFFDCSPSLETKYRTNSKTPRLSFRWPASKGHLSGRYARHGECRLAVEEARRRLVSSAAIAIGSGPGGAAIVHTCGGVDV